MRVMDVSRRMLWLIRLDSRLGTDEFWGILCRVMANEPVKLQARSLRGRV